MKVFLVFVTMVCSVVSYGGAEHRIIFERDSTTHNDSLRIAPYPQNVTVRSLGNFAVVSKDSIAFQTYAASSVLNTLRGHVPNFSMGSNISPTGVGIRSLQSLLIIDGLPFNSDFSSYYNLNSFEYQNAYALSSGNATSFYGGIGSNGAFILTSKNGENFNRPTFEFNSSPSVARFEGSSILGEEETEYHWRFANALAYQQDFGDVDTRLSYSYTSLPSYSDNPESASNIGSLRINTGLTITPRFKARLILDSYHEKTSSETTTEFGGVERHSENEGVNKNRQANLQLSYKLLDWLTLSSQGSLGEWQTKSESSVSGTFPNFSKSDLNQKHSFINVFASFQKSLHPNFVVTAFGGMQYEEIETDFHLESSSMMQGSYSENKTSSILTGVGGQFKDFLYGGFNYRTDKFSLFSDENNTGPTYSFNTSFIFSDAFDWTNSWFSQGKLRASVGKASVAHRQGYPQEWQLQISSIPNPYLSPESWTMMEYGTDLSFIKGRILLSTSYFLNDTENLLVRSPLPPGGGYSYVTANIGELHTHGWEVVLGGVPVRKNDLSLDLKVIWATLNTRVESLSSGNRGGGNGGGIGGEETVLGNPNPDWRGSLLSQLIWKNAFLSFLVNMRKGGDIFIPHYNNGRFEFSIEDGSQAKLQDVSIGYRFASSLLNKAKMRQAQISLSGRNLLTIYSESDVETDNGSSIYTPQKSVSVSLSIMF